MKITNATILAFALLACGFLAVGPAAPEGKGAPAKTAGVQIRNFQFQPREITVKAGTVVTWTNDEGSHTVTSDAGAFASPTLTAGKTYTRKFTKPGTYPYHCSFHGSAGGGDMSGTILVTR